MGLLIFAIILLSLIALLGLLLGSRQEIEPGKGLVYNNIWSGKSYGELPGTTFIVPGIHKPFKEVTIQNEAHNPKNVGLITADGIGLDVDYIVRRMMIGYPDMLDHPTRDHILRLKLCMVRAAVAIDYDKRLDKVQTRIVAALQESISKRKLNDLFPNAKDKDTLEAKIHAKEVDPDDLGEVDKKVMKEIEEEVNEALKEDPVTVEWGFWVEIDLEDYNLPLIVRRAREQKSSAKMAGKAVKEKADAAGVNPAVFVIADALTNMWGGGHNNKKSDQEGEDH